MTVTQTSSKPLVAGKAAGAITNVLLCVAAIGGLAFATFNLLKFSSRNSVHYPYWCKDCKAVFDVSELKKDAKSWRIAPGGGSDSVVICPRCNKGWAYPAVKCDLCGTRHLLHIYSSSECPKCNPEVSKAAAEKSINLSPAGLN
jgi:hypothetical protein